MLFAAQDALNSATTWMFQLVAEHPDVLERVRNEQLAFRENDTQQNFQPAMLERMNYTQCVVREVLRFRPPAVMVPLMAEKKFQLSDNHVIWPSKSTCFTLCDF